MLTLGLMTIQSAHSQTLTTLHSFDLTDGAYPYAGLVQATNGDLYGTTNQGGANNQGTVFKITPSGTLTRLHSFCSQTNCADGVNPEAVLMQATNGDLYGTTVIGGPNGPPNGAGTVFKITLGGTLTTLYPFCSQTNCTDGANSYGDLIQGINGDLYGTTEGGGANSAGSVFKITLSGTLTTIHSFCSVIDCSDGGYPQAGLVQGNNGTLYGTADGGGTTGYGTVFKITPDGTLETLYTFCSQTNCTDGAFPSGLIQATNGKLYGTLSRGGASNSGMVFWITPAGLPDTFYSFCSQTNCADGDSPYAGLIQATDGNFYGTTYSGGANEAGTVFKVTPSGMLTTVYSFCSKRNSHGYCTDGAYTYAGLIQDTNGDLYGTTEYGGANDYGTVFRLSVGLGSFVETQTTSGKVGAAVKILGSDLTGSSSVTFNGTKAVFTLKSKSEIEATVPKGATTGTVEVVTPGSTLKSNVVYTVKP